jgi:membrane-associated protein
MFNPESLIRYGGMLVIFLVVFGQTGLFFCFFLPSGALLFTAGVFVATGGLPYTIYTVCGILVIASFLGNITGYWFGWKTGPLLYKRKDSRFFKREHLQIAGSFYKKYGGIALTAGLFFPIIRTFAPIVAGMIGVKFRRFILFTFIGSVLWILSFVLAGYFLGSIPILKAWLNYIIVIIILAVTTPIVIGIIRRFKKAQKESREKDI